MTCETGRMAIQEFLVEVVVVVGIVCSSSSSFSMNMLIKFYTFSLFSYS